MISLQSPGWLWLLWLLPLIYWLHRYYPRRKRAAVASILLWRPLVASQQQSEKSAKTDKRWLLRALICTLIVLALATPGWIHSSPPSIRLWLDLSISMFARSQQKTRIDRGLQRLDEVLKKLSPESVEVRSLSQPYRALQLNADLREHWLTALQQWIRSASTGPASLPVSAQPDNFLQLLVTDASDPAINQWAKKNNMVVLVENEKNNRNLTLTRLSLRPSLQDDNLIIVMARVDNTGSQTLDAEFSLRQGDKILIEKSLKLEAGQHQTISIKTDLYNLSILTASIKQPLDQLDLDNQLELDPGKTLTPLNYRISAACNRPVRAALLSLPRLQPKQQQANFAVSCETQPANEKIPQLRLFPAVSEKISTTQAHWHHPLISERIPLPENLSYNPQAPLLSGVSRPLLSIDQRALILQQQASPAVISSYLNLDDRALALSASLPLLLENMVDQLTQDLRSHTPLIEQRPLQESRISARPLQSENLPDNFQTRSFEDFSAYLISLSILLLAIDALWPLIIGAAVAGGLGD